MCAKDKVKTLLLKIILGNTKPKQPIGRFHPDPGHIAPAQYSAFYSHIGWDVVNLIAEEIKSSKRYCTFLFYGMKFSSCVKITCGRFRYETGAWFGATVIIQI